MMHEDYRELLVRYMAYVISIEGWDFLESQSHDIKLREYEVETLQFLSNEARELLEKQ